MLDRHGKASAGARPTCQPVVGADARQNADQPDFLQAQFCVSDIFSSGKVRPMVSSRTGNRLMRPSHGKQGGGQDCVGIASTAIDLDISGF